jgi:hypoxanthine phosphoribosyltransferase
MIAHRVCELGREISGRYAGCDLRLITVLKGGVFFLADLCRAIEVPLRVDFLSVAAYSPGAGGSVRMTKDLDDDITDAHVLLVEDVVDTGLTVNYVLTFLRSHGPATVEVCALFNKPGRRIAPVPVSATGFEVSDRFLVGYGLDLHGRYRNLPFVASLKDDYVYG